MTEPAVEPISDAAARLFYDRLFESDPAIKRLFAKTDMQAQRGILMQTLALLEIVEAREKGADCLFAGVLGEFHTLPFRALAKIVELRLQPQDAILQLSFLLGEFRQRIRGDGRRALRFRSIGNGRLLIIFHIHC